MKHSSPPMPLGDIAERLRDMNLHLATTLQVQAIHREHVTERSELRERTRKLKEWNDAMRAKRS